MSSSGMSPEASSEVAGPATVDLKLEVVTLPVSDVDRAKQFYQGLGWRLDADIVAGDHFRVVQLTPPRSECSISFGKGVTTAEPGSAQRLLLVVDDIGAAREELVSRGAEVSGLFHLDGGPVPGRLSRVVSVLRGGRSWVVIVQTSPKRPTRCECPNSGSSWRATR